VTLTGVMTVMLVQLLVLVNVHVIVVCPSSHNHIGHESSSSS